MYIKTRKQQYKTANFLSSVCEDENKFKAKVKNITRIKGFTLLLIFGKIILISVNLSLKSIHNNLMGAKFIFLQKVRIRI